MLGADSRMSDTNRTTSPNRDPAEYSDRYVPTSSPIGVPISVPNPVWIKLPTIAFNSPPPEPGGSVMCVNTPSDRPL